MRYSKVFYIFKICIFCTCGITHVNTVFDKLSKIAKDFTKEIRDSTPKRLNVFKFKHESLEIKNKTIEFIKSQTNYRNQDFFHVFEINQGDILNKILTIKKHGEAEVFTTLTKGISILQSFVKNSDSNNKKNMVTIDTINKRLNKFNIYYKGRLDSLIDEKSSENTQPQISQTINDLISQFEKLKDKENFSDNMEQIGLSSKKAVEEILRKRYINQNYTLIVKETNFWQISYCLLHIIKEISSDIEKVQKLYDVIWEKTVAEFESVIKISGVKYDDRARDHLKKGLYSIWDEVQISTQKSQGLDINEHPLQKDLLWSALDRIARVYSDKSSLSDDFSSIKCLFKRICSLLQIESMYLVSQNQSIYFIDHDYAGRESNFDKMRKDIKDFFSNDSLKVYGLFMNSISLESSGFQSNLFLACQNITKPEDSEKYYFLTAHKNSNQFLIEYFCTNIKCKIEDLQVSCAQTYTKSNKVLRFYINDEIFPLFGYTSIYSDDLENGPVCAFRHIIDCLVEKKYFDLMSDKTEFLALESLCGLKIETDHPDFSRSEPLSCFALTLRLFNSLYSDKKDDYVVKNLTEFLKITEQKISKILETHNNSHNTEFSCKSFESSKYLLDKQHSKYFVEGYKLLGPKKEIGENFQHAILKYSTNQNTRLSHIWKIATKYPETISEIIHISVTIGNSKTDALIDDLFNKYIARASNLDKSVENLIRPFLIEKNPLFSLKACLLILMIFKENSLHQKELYEVIVDLWNVIFYDQLKEFLKISKSQKQHSYFDPKKIFKSKTKPERPISSENSNQTLYVSYLSEAQKEFLKQDIKDTIKTAFKDMNFAVFPIEIKIHSFFLNDASDEIKSLLKNFKNAFE